MNHPAGKNVILGVTGSIAAYKAAEIARALMLAGYSVRAIMTESAQKFLGVATLEALTGEKVLTSFWEESKDVGHIAWADWADLLLVAPATADFLAKLAHGFAESPLLAVALATKAPIAVAPAMNVNMLENAHTRENLAKLSLRGVTIIEPVEGYLACGWQGKGRMEEPALIVQAASRLLGPRDLVGKRVVVSAGPTRERIDPVRFISNRSSGKMGVALAAEAYRRGADVRLIHGLLSVPIPYGVTPIPVESAEQLQSALQYEARPVSKADAVIMAAAVADYRLKEPSDQKLKRSDQARSLELVPNSDILAGLGKARKGGRPVLVGFAVESGSEDELIAEARRKLGAKGCDMVVGNLASEALDSDTNRVWIIRPDREPLAIPTAKKSEVAEQVIGILAELLRDGHHETRGIE